MRDVTFEILAVQDSVVDCGKQALLGDGFREESTALQLLDHSGYNPMTDTRNSAIYVISVLRMKMSKKYKRNPLRNPVKIKYNPLMCFIDVTFLPQRV